MKTKLSKIQDDGALALAYLTAVSEGPITLEAKDRKLIAHLVGEMYELAKLLEGPNPDPEYHQDDQSA